MSATADLQINNIVRCVRIKLRGEIADRIYLPMFVHKEILTEKIKTINDFLLQIDECATNSIFFSRIATSAAIMAGFFFLLLLLITNVKKLH